MIVEPAEWKARVVSTGCVVHADPSHCQWPLQAHHILTQQSLRKRGLDHLRWDVRNGLCVCELAHRRHTLAVERIPYEALPSDAIEFAVEVGLDYQLDRYYPRRHDGET